MKYQFELTDTFGGEANYSWVKRTVVDIPDGTSKVLLVALAKQWANLTGTRCETENYGDAFTLRPRGLCQVLFITDAAEPDRVVEALGRLVRFVENVGVERNPALAGCNMKALENARKVLCETEIQ